MDMRKIVGLVIIAFVLLLIAVGISAMGGGSVESPNNGVPEGAVDVFTTETRNKVIAELGQPIEGFEPFMFLRVYPGLMESDFDGVDALIGTYQYGNGELTYNLGNEREVHSAARAISDEGMATLLDNVSLRLGVSVETEANIANVIEAIEIQMENDTQEEGGDSKTIAGEVVCLPHKDREGPQTMECAFGLLALNGNYYGLANLNQDDLISGRINTGDEVRVTGTIIPPQPQNIYDVIGIIEVEVVEEL
jgi:hypothetical protein